MQHVCMQLGCMLRASLKVTMKYPAATKPQKDGWYFIISAFWGVEATGFFLDQQPAVNAVSTCQHSHVAVVFPSSQKWHDDPHNGLCLHEVMFVFMQSLVHICTQVILVPPVLCSDMFDSRDCNVAVCMQGTMNELRSLREARDALDDQIQRMQWGLAPCPPNHPDTIATSSASHDAPVAVALGSRSLSTPPPTAQCSSEK